MTGARNGLGMKQSQEVGESWGIGYLVSEHRIEMLWRGGHEL